MNHELKIKILSYLKRNSSLYIGIIAFIFIACIMFVLGRNIENTPDKVIHDNLDKLVISNQVLQDKYNSLQKQYSVLNTDYQTAINELTQLKDKYSVNQSLTNQIKYSKYGGFSTFDVRDLLVRLGKGDKFEGHFIMQTRVITGPVPEKDWKWVDGGEVIFTVEGNNKKLIDAGRIQNEYSFEFVAEVSGDYRLIFVDPTYKTHVDLYYNCLTTIQNLDVNR
jgi:hypothetical protein